MAAKKYVCTNFANCDAALSKQVIEIEDGEDPVCPACGKPNTLVPAGGVKSGGGNKTGGLPKSILIAVAALILLGIIGFLLWPKPPNPELANSMIADFFPRLK
jgi:hypothetical protein